ncbi:MAG: hypothetical protein HY064_13325 [Bacteroidetes bacterium]|nr:hypothetical protein [Bacteroidota bacterium]
MKLRLHILLVSVALYSNTTAQNSTWKFQKGGNWYFSWGYGKFWYPKTNLYFDENYTDPVAKEVVHSEYTLYNVKAHDRLGLEKLYNVPLTVPQFCVRIGYFFNEKQDLGIELTYDHAKFIASDYQYVEMKGTTNGVAFDSLAYLYPDRTTGPKPFVYKLNNGANFFEFNLVKKFILFDSKNGMIHLSYITKCGAGWNTPHVENEIFGEKNKPHFQPIGGWNVGAEAAVRCVFFNRAYLEFGQKGVYANYYKLRNAQGVSRQQIATYELVLSLGVNFPSHIHAIPLTDSEKSK